MGQIITLGNPILRHKARKVTKFGPELKQFIDNMIGIMQISLGVGLAASQINVPERIIVLGFEEKIYAFINPEIVKVSREMETDEEGCLSIPGYVGEVARHVEVIVRGQDAFGKLQQIKARDYLARIFQHEIDHLNGVFFIDKADPVTIHRYVEKNNES